MGQVVTAMGMERVPVRVYDANMMKLVSEGTLAVVSRTDIAAVGLTLVNEDGDDTGLILQWLPIGSGGARAFAAALESARDDHVAVDVPVVGSDDVSDTRMTVSSVRRRPEGVYFYDFDAYDDVFAVNPDDATTLASAIRAADRYVAAYDRTLWDYHQYLLAHGMSEEIAYFEERFGDVDENGDRGI